MKLFYFCLVTLVFGVPNALAVPVPSFTGTYDEASGVEAAGDYDNIGPNLGFPSDIGDFNLVGGINTFSGSIGSGVVGDSSDVFNIVIGANQTLVGASLSYGTNASAFNPFFGFPGPAWGLFESSVTPEIFNVSTPGQGFSAFTSTQTFTRGPGIYNMLIGNGVFGMSDNSPVDYTMTFTVEETSTVVPLPAALPLLIGGLGVLGLAGYRRRNSK